MWTILTRLWVKRSRENQPLRGKWWFLGFCFCCFGFGLAGWEMIGALVAEPLGGGSSFEVV